MTVISHIWESSERRRPDAVAVAWDGNAVTYRELSARIRERALELVTQMKVRRGDLVALLAPNGVEFIVDYFAVTAIGATIQPVDFRRKDHEVTELLRGTRATALLAHGGRTEELPESLVAGDSAKVAPPSDPIGDFKRDRAVGETIAELLHTSGTTYAPKGVLRSHRGVLAAMRNAQAAFGYREDDVIGIVMPLTHSSALTSQLLPVLNAGGTVVPIARFEPASVVRALRGHGVTCFRAVPTMFELLLAQEDFRRDHLPAIRLLMGSSATFDPRTRGALQARFPGLEIMDSYGLTEASTCTVLSGADAAEHPGSIGVPVPGVEIRIVNRSGFEVAAGEEGEIWVRGPHLFSGYASGAEESLLAIASGGWLKTCDLGTRDSSGFLYLRGRTDNQINCGGWKFSGPDVERCIRALPGVADVAVVGVPHRVLGEVAQAFVTLRKEAGVDGKEILRHCSRHLPSHMVPFRVKLVDRIPRSDTGKVLHRSLQESAQERR